MEIKAPDIGYIPPKIKHPIKLVTCPTCGVVFQSEWKSRYKRYQIYDKKKCSGKANSRRMSTWPDV